MSSSNVHKIVAGCGVVIITFCFFVTYYGLRQETATSPKTKFKDVVPAKVQVYEDEAFLKNSTAIIGGTVKNISVDKIVDLNIEVELADRNSNQTAKRIVKVTPRELLPNQEGRYSLSVPSQSWSNARLVRLFDNSNNANFEFKSAPGARRPPQPPPRSVIVTEQIKRPPASKPRKDEFINTPETPIILR